MFVDGTFICLLFEFLLGLLLKVKSSVGMASRSLTILKSSIRRCSRPRSASCVHVRLSIIVVTLLLRILSLKMKRAARRCAKAVSKITCNEKGGQVCNTN